MWTNDRTHGLQFRAAFLKAAALTTLESTGKYLCVGPVYVLVGQRRALAIAVRGQQTRRRWSKLKEWLRS